MGLKSIMISAGDSSACVARIKASKASSGREGSGQSGMVGVGMPDLDVRQTLPAHQLHERLEVGLQGGLQKRVGDARQRRFDLEIYGTCQ